MGLGLPELRVPSASGQGASRGGHFTVQGGAPPQRQAPCHTFLHGIDRYPPSELLAPRPCTLPHSKPHGPPLCLAPALPEGPSHSQCCRPQSGAAPGRW